MKKVICMMLVLVMLAIFTCAVFAEEATFLYVATGGDDSAEGTADEPFATVEKAVEAARSIDGTVVVNIKGGEYALGDTIELTSADNGLVIRANPGEKVVMTGGKKIRFEDFAKETDAALLKRIITGSAREKVITADLTALGITELGNIAVCGMGINQDYAPSLTYNDRYLTVAQYPNGKDYIYTGEIKDNGTNKDRDAVTNGYEIKFTVKDTRWQKWSEAKDIWATGWYIHDWAESITPAIFDFETGVITAHSGYNNVVSDRRVKFFNLFEELDEAGEYYIDREAGKLYMIAPEGFKAGDFLVFSACNQNIINLTGCENITIQGIRFEGTTERGIYGKECKNITIDGCELTAIGRAAIAFDGDNRDVTVKNCYIHDVSSSGIYLSGGDKPTLARGNNVAENCHIERFMRYKLTYASGAALAGVGNRISHCEINDAPHQGIGYNGVYNVIEYNNIYRVCTDSSDCGAIYTGRNWADRNNEIRHNYFHDLSMIDTTAGMEMQAVYLDDMHASTAVYGNVFYRCDSVALYGGGRDNTFENNLMLDCKKPLVFDARGTTWMHKDSGNGQGLYSNLEKSPYKTELWQETFPTLANVLENKPAEPVGNVIKNNLLYNTDEMKLDPLVAQNGTVEPAMEVKKTDFVDYGKDFRVREDSDVFTKLPGFRQIEFEKMGRYDYAVEDEWVDNGKSSSESNDSIEVLLNGEKIDFVDVEPQIINDRTMVPLRAIFEALGAEVSWDDATKTVTAVKGEVTIKMTIGADFFTRNDEPAALDSPATIVDSRTLVPVRAIAESFGSAVGWIAETKTVTITTAEEIEKLIDENVDSVAIMEAVGAQLKEALANIKNPDEPVMTVNNIPITRKTLELQKAMATIPGADSLKNELVKIVRQKVVVAEATRLGIEPSEESINQYIEMIENALKQGASGAETMLAYIRGLGITVEEFIEEQRKGAYDTYQIEAFRQSLDKDTDYEDYVNELVQNADVVILDDEVQELFGAWFR